MKIIRNNKGFTLIELILAMLIMVTLVGAISISSGIIHKTKTKSAASNIYAAIGQLKTYTLSKAEGEYVDILHTTEGIVLRRSWKNDVVILNTRNANVAYSIDGNDFIDIDDVGLRITINRATEELKSPVCSKYLIIRVSTGTWQYDVKISKLTTKVTTGRGGTL